MIDNRSLQTALRCGRYYDGAIDGIFGPNSRKARDLMLADEGIETNGWDEDRLQLALNQWVMTKAGIEAGTIDGWDGPQTRFALEQWQNHLRDLDPSAREIDHQSTIFPRQKDALDFYGAPGTNHVRMTFPYPMRIAWNLSQSVTTTMINAKCAESAARAFQRALDHYGYERIQELGLDLYGGCYANRKMRGGSKISTHAFAAALDINPAANRLRWGSSRAAMAKPECAPFLEAFESEGWISLGRERNFDWMHLQAVRL